MNANTAAPDPSAASIAQAVRETLEGSAVPMWGALFSRLIERAREIDASAPAAAVGGDIPKASAATFVPSFSEAARALGVAQAREDVDAVAQWSKTVAAYEAAAKAALATPAAPVGGFVVVCKTCNGGGCVDGFVAHPSGDPQDSYAATLPCPQCDGVGEVRAPANTDDVVFQGTTATFQSAYFGEWSAARAWAGKNGSVTMHTVRRLELAASPAAKSSAKDGARVDETLPTWLLVLIGNYGFASANSTDVEKLHRWELLMDGIKAYRREATTGAGLVDGPVITGYTVEDHEDWFTDPGDAAEMLREYADAEAGSEFYLTPWHQLPRQTLRITGPEYEDYEVEAAIGREVGNG